MCSTLENDDGVGSALSSKAAHILTGLFPHLSLRTLSVPLHLLSQHLLVSKEATPIRESRAPWWNLYTCTVSGRGQCGGGISVPGIVVSVVDSYGVPEAGERSVQLLCQNELVTQQSVRIREARVHLRRVQRGRGIS